VLGPLAGVALAAVGTGVAVTENDWGATTIFGLFATTFVFVGVRNFRWLSDRK